MTDAAPFGVPVTYLKRYLVRGTRVVEQVVEAESLDQAAAVGLSMARGEGVKVMSIELLPEAKSDTAFEQPDEGPIYELPPHGLDGHL